MIKERRLNNLKKILQNFKDGNFETPIDVDGVGEYNDILCDLEQIRGNMLVLQNRENQIIEKNKTAVANITHDMKTPLALITGYAESMQCGMDDKDYLDLILQKTSYLNELVLKIISSSKEDIEQIPKLKEKIDVQDFFIKEINSYAHLAETKDIKIIIGAIPKVKIFADKKEYKSVIQNLMTNSIKYGKYKGKVKILFKVKDNYLEVKVRDDGIGIKKEKLPYVFDKFYKGDEARTSSNSGLGLSIVKQIVEDNGGIIKCRSKEGSFTEFVFTVPVYRELIENDKLRETLPKIENKVESAVKRVNTKSFTDTTKKVLLTLILSVYLIGGFLVQSVFAAALVGIWVLDIVLVLGSLLNFILMGIVVANNALIPIVLSFFGMSIFSLGFFFILSSDIFRLTNKILMLIKELYRHMLHITTKIYGGAR